MRRVDVNLSRAVPGAIPAAASLLLVLFVSSHAYSADGHCDRMSALDAPSGQLHVEVVDLAPLSAADPTDLPDRVPGLTPDKAETPLEVMPDLSSRARSLAILREIFGEPVSTEDDLELGVVTPPVDADTDEALPLRRPAAGVPDIEPAAPGTPASEDDARQPADDDPGALRYRSQMYRTDI